MLLPSAVSPHILADANPWTQWVIVAAIVAGTAIILLKSKYRPKKDPLTRSPESGSLAQHRSVERQMQSLLVELSEMSRQVTAGLDTRAAKLDALIREADDKIAQLSSLRNGNGVAESIHAHAAAGPRFDMRDDEDRAKSAAVVEPRFAAGSFATEASAYDPDPRHAQIYMMADEGHSAAEIATRLQRPAGEIQLILALRAK